MSGVGCLLFIWLGKGCFIYIFFLSSMCGDDKMTANRNFEGKGESIIHTCCFLLVKVKRKYRGRGREGCRIREE